MERESHAVHVNNATGVVVVAGVGMGMFLRSICEKHSVSEIHAYDISQDVLDLLIHGTDFESWPGGEKITLHCHDAKDIPSDDVPAKVDYFYADIWPTLGTFEAIADVRLMQKRVKAAAVGYWGEELDLISWLIDHEIPVSEWGQVSHAQWLSWRNSTGLPLVSPGVRWLRAYLPQIANRLVS